MTTPAALAHALELIGERWALLVLRELMLGPRRFSELQGRPAGDQRQRAHPAADRARGARAGSVRRGCRRRRRCRFTKRRAGGWRRSRSSRRSAAGRREARATTRRCRSAACRSCCRCEPCSTERARGIEGASASVFGDDRLCRAQSPAASSTSSRGDVDGCDVAFAGEPATLAAVVYGGAPLDPSHVEGDLGLAERFVDLFELPPKAA